MGKIRRFFSGVTGKKHHVEFFTALLSIPVLLTVITLNLSNLNASKKVEPSPKPNQIIISLPTNKQTLVTNAPTKPACLPGIGNVSISYPREGDIISDYPVAVTVSYEAKGYCAVVWSYRINGGSWSEFDDKSVALYDLPSGNITLDLRVKSVINGGGDTTLSRTFTYKRSKATPTADPTATVTPTQAITPNPTGN